MPSDLQLTGLHHVSAVTGDIRANRDFYTGVLGMRLVKKTVNQDDVSVYHLFYADALGSAGTDVTFFDFPYATRERRGTGTVSRTALRVAGEAALHFWAERLDAHGVRHGPVHERDGRLTLDLDDPEGQRLALVDDGGAGEAHPWAADGTIPAEHAIRGLGFTTLALARLAPTDTLLTDVLGMRLVRTYADPESHAHTVHVFEMGEGGTHAEIHIAERPDLAPARPGAGGVHHVAFRVPDEARYHAWTAHLARYGVPTSGEVDRFYFRSLYFRTPGGVLFELATDGPGFHTDEPLETMGESLALPPFLEPRRAEIEAGLKPL